MYEYPVVTYANDMKDGITRMGEIKSKLTKSGFFSYENLFSIQNFLNPNVITVDAIDVGIDRVIKFGTPVVVDIIRNLDIPRIMRSWFLSHEMTLSGILVAEDLQFLILHSDMFYQIEMFEQMNSIYVRI